jgi:hypothetical protein
MNRSLEPRNAIWLALEISRRDRSSLQESRLGYRFVGLVAETIESKLEAIGYAQLVIELAQVVLDHLLCRTELGGNFLVALALRDAGDDGQLFT